MLVLALSESEGFFFFSTPYDQHNLKAYSFMQLLFFNATWVPNAKLVFKIVRPLFAKIISCIYFVDTSISKTEKGIL